MIAAEAPITPKKAEYTGLASEVPSLIVNAWDRETVDFGVR